MLSDREKFIYFATALSLNPKCAKMPHDKRTILLALFRNEHCKTLTNKEWTEIFLEIEKLRYLISSDVFESLLMGYDKNKIANMFADFITKGYIEV